MTSPKAAKRAGARAGIFVKRAYAEPVVQDGTRVLVDGLWPRGLQKDKARIDVWLKEIAPSAELRRWFHHDPARWSEFQRKYRDELLGKEAIVDSLWRLTTRGAVTLLFGSRDLDHNNAVVLQSFLLARGLTRAPKARR